MNDPATKLPPLSVGAIAHMEGEDHLYGTAFRERTRQLSLALELLKEYRKSRIVCNGNWEDRCEICKRLDASGLLGEIGGTK